jgi:HemY protein
MIMRVFIIFSLLLFSLCAGLYLHTDPGYVLVTFNQWSLETTLSVCVLCLMVLFFIVHLLLLSLHWVCHIPISWSNWRAKRRTQYAQNKTRQGLIEFSEGHWLRAKNHLIKALPDADIPLLNYLTAARAAQEMGDSKQRDDYLRDAQRCMPEAKIAVELTQAQLQLASRQWEQALATLRYLQDLVPNHPYVLKLLMHLYEEVKDWPQLIALLPAIKRHKVLEGEAFIQLQKRAYLETTRNLIKLNQESSLREWVKKMPKPMINDPDFIKEYTLFLLSHQDEVQAEVLLRNSLKTQFNEQLIALYAQLKLDKKQLTFLESRLKENPHSAGLYLCLGRISLSHQLWGKARLYLEKSIEYTPTPDAYAELGQLFTQLGDETKACDAYRRGLELYKTKPYSFGFIE